MRHSSSAQLLREGLLGFEVSEEEFRQLFRLRRVFDEQVRNITETDEGDLMAEWRRFQETVGQVLGPERSALFQQAQNVE